MSHIDVLCRESGPDLTPLLPKLREQWLTQGVSTAASSKLQMVKRQKAISRTQELICIAVRGCPFDLKNMTPFSFHYSVFTVCPFVGVWEVAEVFGQGENVPVLLLLDILPHSLLPMNCLGTDGFSGQGPIRPHTDVPQPQLAGWHVSGYWFIKLLSASITEQFNMYDAFSEQLRSSMTR